MTGRFENTRSLAGRKISIRRGGIRSRFKLPSFFGCLFSYVSRLYCCINGGTLASCEAFSLCSPSSLPRGPSFLSQEEAARKACQHQYRYFRRASASAGNRPSHGAEDSTNAQIVRAVQERGRFIGHSRTRPKTPGQNAQVSDGWESQLAKSCTTSDAGASPSAEAAGEP